MGHATMEMLTKTYGKFFENADEVREWVRQKTQNGHNGQQFEEFFYGKQ